MFKFGSRSLWAMSAVSMVMLSCKPRTYNSSEVKQAPGIPQDGGEQFQTGNLMANQLGLKPMDVVLTFDDGPSPLSVPLAKFLANKGVKANWFINFKNASDMSSSGAQDMIKTICSLGHQVGNHNFGHTYNTNRWSQLTEVHNKIISLCPGERPIYYRAPGGGWKGGDASGLNAAVDSRGIPVATQYIGPVFWDVACDTEQTPAGCKSKNAATLADAYYGLIMAKARSHGVVVLGHDVPWHAATVHAFMDTNLVDRLKNAGVNFVQLDNNPAVTQKLLGGPISAASASNTGAIAAKADAIVKQGISKYSGTNMLAIANSNGGDMFCKDGTKYPIQANQSVPLSAILAKQGDEVEITLLNDDCSDKTATLSLASFIVVPQECVVSSDQDSNVRSSAGVLSDNIISKVSPGTVIKPTGKNGSWYQFDSNGQKAFIHQGQLNSVCTNFPL